MESLETEKLVDDGSPSKHSDYVNRTPSPSISDKQLGKRHYGTRFNTFSILLEPFQWLQMLCSQLNPSFVLGVLLVYGLNQGFAGSYFKVLYALMYRQMGENQFPKLDLSNNIEVPEEICD